MRRTSVTRTPSTAETSPLVGLLFFGLTAALFASLGAAMSFGSTPSDADAGAGIRGDFDAGDREVRATYVADKNAAYVNVTVRTPSGALRARLDRPGASLTLTEEEAWVEGPARLYDLENDLIVDHAEGGQSGVLAEQGPGHGETVELQAVAVTEDGTRALVFDRSGSI